MKRFLAALIFLSSIAFAWDIEELPTTLQYNGVSPYLITTELASAYRPVYNASGVKTSENIAIAYRSKYLYVMQKQGTTWNTIRFDDNGRYPSIALDDAGKPHMTYYRSSNKKVYYARTVNAGTGNCGPNLSWACEELPPSALFFEAPKGRSAITVRGNKITIIYDVPGTGLYLSRILMVEKVIGGPSWVGFREITLTELDTPELSIQHDQDGLPNVLIQSQYIDWYKVHPSYLQAVGPLDGRGDFALTSGGFPRLCYRDSVANRLIYALSNGVSYWTEKVLDYDISTLGNCSIAIAPPGATGIVQVIGLYNPRIAYYDSGSNALKYAIHPILTNTNWSVQTVDTPTGTRKFDLHLDRQARPTIIYFDSTSKKLKIAK